MDATFFITAFATLFVVIDPIGLTPIFLALTQGMSPKARRAIGIRAVATAAILLGLFAGFGEAVLGFIGISMPAFRTAGGLLLFLTALDMLFDRRTKRREDQADEDDGPDPSVFPLGLPLLAGPGAIAAVILLTGQRPGFTGWLAVMAVVACVLAIAITLFFSANLIERGLGKTGVNVVTRLLGMLLAALAVQFVLDGLAQSGVIG